MKYTNLYKQIANPLDDQQVMEQLIDAYAESSGFYSALTNRYSKDKQMVYSMSASDDLHASIFNRWKKELLSITTEQYEKAIKDGLYKRNIFKLLSLLRRTPDVKTKKEADEILNKAYQDKELEEAMEAYRWDSIGAFSGWTHISNRHINGKKTTTPKIEHRFYINTHLMDVHTMSKIFMDKCIEYDLPFYFKIGEYDRRDDNIVIYSNTQLLPHYLTILKQIEKEHPELVKRCGRPPVLSGIIRNWIGYGSEPISLSGKESFNGIRAKSIEKAIDEELLSWYRSHPNLQVNYKGQPISFTEYIARQVTLTKTKRMLDYRRRNPQSTYIKYTEADISSNEFMRRMANLVNAQMPTIFNGYIQGQKPSVKIEVPIKQGATTTLYTYDVMQEIKKFIKIVAKNDPDFINRVRERIKKDARSKGIDPDKYCFDIENVELLKKAEAETEPKKKSEPTKKTPTDTSSKTTSTKPSGNTTKQPTKVEDGAKYHRPAGTPTHYKPMTDEEILESQRKLAECPLVQSNSKVKTTSITRETPKYHRPAGTPMYYKPMTDEEILESQRKLAECPMVKVKRK